MNDQTIHDDDFIDPDLDAALHEAWRRGAGKAFEDYRNRRNALDLTCDTSLPSPCKRLQYEVDPE